MGRSSTSRRLGNLSLAAMVGGMAVMELLIHLGMLQGEGWRILATGFEAGTIGALADWYAVRAMFHEVPVPLLRRHSNILLRNRARITDAIVDAVQNKWLSSEAISEFLSRQSPSQLVLDYLRTPQHQRQILDGLRHMLRSALARAETHSVEKLLEQVVRDQLQAIDLAQPLGRWLVGTFEGRHHHVVWDSLLNTLDKALDDPQAHATLSDAMKRTAARYAQSGMMKGLGKRVMEAAGMIHYPAMASASLDEARQFVDQARHNPDHPLRRRLDQSLLDWARELEQGQGDAVETVNHWRDRLARDVELAPLIHGMVSRLRQTLQEQLATPDGHLAQIIEHWLIRQLNQLAADVHRQQAIDQWVRQRVPAIVARYSHLIGEVVRGKLAAAGDAQWVRDIEDNVGDDLQYIRLNGAIVGFGVGLGLATVRWGLALWFGSSAGM